MKHVGFEVAILICIVLNTIQMAIIFEGASADYEAALENINLGFTLIFMMEAIFKIIGLGPKSYFHINWNRFDFFVVVASIIDLILALFLGEAIKFLRVGP
jgi:hypothetical protein